MQNNSVITTSMIIFLLVINSITVHSKSAKKRASISKSTNLILKNFRKLVKDTPITSSANDNYDVQYTTDRSMRQKINPQDLHNFNKYLKVVFNKRLMFYHIGHYENKRLLTSWLINIKTEQNDYIVNYDHKGKLHNISYFDNANHTRQWIFFNPKDRVIQVNFYKEASNNLTTSISGTLYKINKYKNNKIIKSFKNVKKANIPIIPRIGNTYFKGGNGRSIKKAIKIIQTQNHASGVLMEYKYIRKVYGQRNVDWIPLGQSLIKKNGRKYDKLKIKTNKNNVVVKIFFDITSFYPKK